MPENHTPPTDALYVEQFQKLKRLQAENARLREASSEVCAAFQAWNDDPDSRFDINDISHRLIESLHSLLASAGAGEDFTCHRCGVDVGKELTLDGVQTCYKCMDVIAPGGVHGSM